MKYEESFGTPHILFAAKVKVLLPHKDWRLPCLGIASPLLI